MSTTFAFGWKPASKFCLTNDETVFSIPKYQKQCYLNILSILSHLVNIQKWPTYTKCWHHKMLPKSLIQFVIGRAEMEGREQSMYALQVIIIFFLFLESVTDQIFILAKYNFQYFQSVNFGLAFYGYFPPLWHTGSEKCPIAKEAKISKITMSRTSAHHNHDTQALKAVVPGFEKAKLRNFGMTIGDTCQLILESKFNNG